MKPRRLAAGGPALLVVLLALAGPWLLSLSGGSSTTPVGGPFKATGEGVLLGTDVLGRDVLARVLAGGYTLVLQAVAATILGSLIGLTIGTWAGITHRTRTAAVVLRVVDTIAALPALLLLLLLAAGLPGNDAVVSIAIAIVSAPFSVRVVRERVRALAATDYARETLARGDHSWSRIRYDIRPGLIPVALAEAGIRFVAATQIAATAAFLGLGAAAPAASWGRMVRENSVGLASNPWGVLAPALLLVVLAIGVTALLDRTAELQPGSLTRIEDLA